MLLVYLLIVIFYTCEQFWCTFRLYDVYDLWFVCLYESLFLFCFSSYALSLAQSSALCVFALSHLWWMKLKHRGFNHANNRCSFVECAKKLFVFLGGSVFFVFSISMWITGMKANTEFDDTWQGPTYEFLKAFVGQTVGIHQQYNAEHSLRRTLRGRNCVGN